MTRRLPAEWEPQAAVLLTWPHEGTDWRPWLSETEGVYARLAAEISRRLRVIIVCTDDDHKQHVATHVDAQRGCLENVDLFAAPSNDTWMRDYGPITVHDGARQRLMDFRFDGWGGQFPAGLDDALTGRLHAAGAFGETPLEHWDTVLEGGSIDTDGNGTLLSTRHCLQSRLAPGETLAQKEDTLKALLGIERVLWLEHGRLDGDDTGGHVDTLARFCDPHTITYVACDDPADPHHGELARMAEGLRALRTRDGLAYRLVPLPWPRPQYGDQGERLPATYANFLVTNGAVLVPAYGGPADAVALERLGECFPGRVPVGIPCLPLLRQYGSLHCVTMQLPAPPHPNV